MILTVEQRADYLHELLAIQHFVTQSDAPDIETKVVEVPEVIPVDPKAKDVTYLIEQLCDYNYNLVGSIPGISATEKISLERRCRYRVAKQVFEKHLLGGAAATPTGSGFFSKIDKWIQFPGEHTTSRLETPIRTIITVSTNYRYTSAAIDIKTAITAVTIKNFEMPSLQDLLGSLSV